jgi:hypothetical protein
MTNERRDLDAVRATGNELRDEDRGKVEGFAAAMVPADDCPEIAEAGGERLRVTLESVLDGTIRLEYGWSPQARAYRYWFVAKGRISPISYPSRFEAAVAASETLAANESP